MENRSESTVQYEVLEYVWHSAKTFDTRGTFRKSVQKLLKDIADNGAVNFERLLQDLKEEAEGVEIKIPLENLELIRCYQCEHFKPIGRGTSGWCQDAKPKIRVQAVDFCDEAVKKEAEG